MRHSDYLKHGKDNYCCGVGARAVVRKIKRQRVKRIRQLQKDEVRGWTM